MITKFPNAFAHNGAPVLDAMENKLTKILIKRLNGENIIDPKKVVIEIDSLNSAPIAVPSNRLKIQMIPHFESLFVIGQFHRLSSAFKRAVISCAEAGLGRYSSA